MGFIQRRAARHEQREWDRLEKRLGFKIPREQRVDYLFCSRVPDPPQPAVEGAAYLTTEGLLMVPETGKPRFFDHLDLDSLRLTDGSIIHIGVREHDTGQAWSFVLRSNQPDLLTNLFFKRLLAERATWMETAVQRMGSREAR